MTGTTPLSAIRAALATAGSPVSRRSRPPMRRQAWLSVAPNPPAWARRRAADGVARGTGGGHGNALGGRCPYRKGGARRRSAHCP
jgi:hypothetical protein